MYEIIGIIGINMFWCFIEIYIFIVDKFSFICNLFFPKIKDSILYIKNGKEYQSWNENLYQMQFDLVIITKNDYKLVLPYNNIPKNIAIKDLVVEPSEYKFISAEIEVPSLNQKYSMNLDKYFFVKDSIIYSKEMIYWFLKNNYSLNITANTKYRLTFIDNKVNILNIDNTKSIVIRENDYNIIEVIN